jgi:uncharacterized SAM-binding protein YcdF (DUF218 family)
MTRFGGVTRDLRLLLGIYRGEKVFGGAERLPEVVVVLGTQVLAGGRPSRTLEARTLHAARRYAEGEVRLLIPTGGVGEHPPSEASVMARILRESEVPEEDVLIEDQAQSTWESAVRIKGMLAGQGVEKVAVVTDPLHCVRTVAAFRAVGLEAVAEPVYSSPMWRDGWLRTGQLLREMGALLWYRTRRRAA